MKQIVELAEEIHRRTDTLLGELEKYNPGRCVPRTERIDLGTLNVDAAIIESKVDKLRSMICAKF